MLTLEQAGRYGPLLLITCAALWAISRAYVLKRGAGVSVFVTSFGRKSFVEMGLALLGISLDLYLVLRAFYPAIDTKLASLFPGLPLEGLFMMAAGLLTMGFAQAQMGRAWRVGIPESKEGSQQIIDVGLFGYSRNPIYVGVFFFIAGATALIPNLFTLACLLTYCPLISLQVRREEAFMAAQFGADYMSYTKRVRRWV